MAAAELGKRRSSKGEEKDFSGSGRKSRKRSHSRSSSTEEGARYPDKKSKKKKKDRSREKERGYRLKVQSISELAELVKSGQVQVPRSLVDYQTDRFQLLDQVFTILSPDDVKGMLPDILKNLKTKHVRQLCYEHLKTLSEDEIRHTILLPSSPSAGSSPCHAQGSLSGQDTLTGYPSVEGDMGDSDFRKEGNIGDKDLREGDMGDSGFRKEGDMGGRKEGDMGDSGFRKEGDMGGRKEGDIGDSDLREGERDLREGDTKGSVLDDEDSQLGGESDEIIITVSDVSDGSDEDGAGDSREKGHTRPAERDGREKRPTENSLDVHSSAKPVVSNQKKPVKPVGAGKAVHVAQMGTAVAGVAAKKDGVHGATTLTTTTTTTGAAAKKTGVQGAMTSTTKTATTTVAANGKAGVYGSQRRAITATTTTTAIAVAADRKAGAMSSGWKGARTTGAATRQPPPPPPTPPPALKTTTRSLPPTTKTTRKVPPPPPPTPPPPSTTTIATPHLSEGGHSAPSTSKLGTGRRKDCGVQGNAARNRHIPSTSRQGDRMKVDATKNRRVAATLRQGDRGQGNVTGKQRVLKQCAEMNRNQGNARDCGTSNQGVEMDAEHERTKDDHISLSVVGMDTDQLRAGRDCGHYSRVDDVKMDIVPPRADRDLSTSIGVVMMDTGPQCDRRTDGSRNDLTISKEVVGGGRIMATALQETTALQPSTSDRHVVSELDSEARTVGSAQFLEMELRRRALEAELRRNNASRRADGRMLPDAHNPSQQLGQEEELRESMEEEEEMNVVEGVSDGGVSEEDDAMCEDAISLHPECEGGEEGEGFGEREEGGCGLLKVGELLEERLRQRALQVMLEKKRKT